MCWYSVGDSTDLQGLRHDAAHHSTHSQGALHVPFTNGGLQLVDGNQPGPDGRGGRTQQIELPVNRKNNKQQLYTPVGLKPNR